MADTPYYRTLTLSSIVVPMAGLEPARALLPKGFSYHLQLSLLLSDLWSGLYLHHFTGAPRQVSTRPLSGFARYCHFTGFTEFEELHS